MLPGILAPMRASARAAAFVGRGRYFEIWEPAGARQPTRPRRASARSRKQPHAAPAAAQDGGNDERQPRHAPHRPCCCAEVIEALAPQRRRDLCRRHLRRRRLQRARCWRPRDCTVWAHRPRSRCDSEARRADRRYAGRPASSMQGRFGDMRRAAERRAASTWCRRRRARSRRVLDADRPARSAASPSASTARSTCAWSARAERRRSRQRRWPSGDSPISSSPYGEETARPRHRPRHRRARAAGADHPHPRIWRRSCAAPSAAGQADGSRSGDAQPSRPCASQ